MKKKMNFWFIGKANSNQTLSDFDIEPDGGVVITKYKGKGGDLSIPARIDGKAVTGIGDSAFFECRSLSSVTIPEGVTSIGASAFSHCSNLATIAIPASVISIGASAFGNGSSLTEISVSPANRQYKDIDGVLFSKDGTTLHAYPAGNVRTAYTIPEGVTSIGASAFSSCEKLISVIIPEGVTSIGESAFQCCGLTSIIIPESVTIIGTQAFSFCHYLRAVTIPECYQHSGESVFYACDGLKPEVRSDIEKRFGESIFW